MAKAPGVAIKTALFVTIWSFQTVLHAQEISTETLWRIETEAPIYGHPVAAGDVIYIGGEDGILRALDRQSGDIIWTYDAGAPIACNAGFDEQRVYVSARDGSVHAVSVESGESDWRFKTEGEKQWDYWDYRLSTPVADHERVYFGSGDHHIYGLNKRNGALRWSVETGGIVHGEPLIDGDKVIAGGFDGVLYAVDRANGKVLWTFKTVGNSYFRNGAIAGSASLNEGVIYVGSRDYNLYAVLSATGTGAWNNRTPSWVIAKPLISDGLVYAATSDLPALFGFTASGGGDRLETGLSSNVYGEAVALGSAHIGVGGKDGRINIVARDGSGISAFHDTAEATALVL